MAKARHKYVVVLVVESSERVTKKAIKDWLLGYMLDATGTPRPATFDTDDAVTAVRVRSVDLD